MKVWVVLFDFGLNGVEVGAVGYRTKEEAEAAAPDLENTLDDEYPVYTRRSATGYGGWKVAEIRLGSPNVTDRKYLWNWYGTRKHIQGETLDNWGRPTTLCGQYHQTRELAGSRWRPEKLDKAPLCVKCAKKGDAT